MKSLLRILYFDYPLEQGLRQTIQLLLGQRLGYFDYPLEQGLRHTAECYYRSRNCILIIH